MDSIPPVVGVGEPSECLGQNVVSRHDWLSPADPKGTHLVSRAKRPAYDRLPLHPQHRGTDGCSK